MNMNRRESLKTLALTPFAAGFSWNGHDVAVARERMAAASRKSGPTAIQFFNEHEYQTVRVLVDMIIPRDERSGSATDVGVPEFIDFMMIDQPSRQTAMRGGLAWIDNRARLLFGKTFLEASDAERRQLLDEIAYPERASTELSHGVSFFNSFRDLTSTGFWTTPEGIADLQFMGNVAVAEWKGCPDKQLEHLGVADIAWPQSDVPSWTEIEGVGSNSQGQHQH